ncbi:hypothetical protein J7E70_02270 [Variovorax paradoxus]|nr:hypothetical protein [Variovorax paradoxus]MBT2299279.1 hypothetical protein [Variovorax paradoxus]
MFEAYSVGVTLRINNLASPTLALIARDLEKLETLSVALKSTLRTIGAESAGLRAIAAAGNASATALERATRSAQSLQAHLAAVRATSASMPAIAPHMGGGSGGGGGPRVIPGVGGGGGGGGGHAGGGHGRNQGGFHGGNIHMGPGGIGIGSVGLGAGNAFVPLAVTAGMLYGGHSLYEAARDYETAATRFKTLNLGAEVNKQANDFARGTRVFGVASKDLMDTVRESVGMFGSMPNAVKLAPMIAQLNAANSGLFGGKIGGIDEGAARSLMRFNDMRGLTDSPQDFMRGLNLAQRMVTGSGGALKFSDLEQMAKRGGAAFKGLSDEGIMMLGTLAQEQGGATTGTALMSLYQNLVAGRTTKKTMAALSEAGLVTLGSVMHGNVGGKAYSTTQITAIKDEKMLRENPAQWLMTYGTAAAKAAGATTDSEIISFMNKLVSNRTGSNMAANFTTQQMQALRDQRLIKGAMGAEQTVGAWQKTLGGKEAEFIASWNNFKTEFGTAALPAFSNMLTNAAGFLRSVSGFMERNAGLISAMGTGIGWLDKFSPTGVLKNAIGAGLDVFGGAKGESWGGEGRRGAGGAGGFVGNSTGGGAFTGYRAPRGAGAQMVQVESTVVLDGKAIGRAVTQHQAKEMTRPSTGARTADGRMSLRAFDIATGG